jgi:hypothetical protein
VRRLLFVAMAVACSTANEPVRFEAPGKRDFRYVSGMLHGRCGSLDCHGHDGRSLRLYGKFGLRLSKQDLPGGRHETPEEVDANYASVVGLEPEVLAAVFRDGGFHPERLTLVRKAWEIEAHKGGRALDDEGARCLRSWLEGEVDARACFSASTLAKPPGFFAPGAGGTGGTGGSGGSGGSGGTGGSGGSGGIGGTGGTGGTGGKGGTGGSGGTGGTGGIPGLDAGVVCAPGDYWPCTFDPGCVAKPAPDDHLAYVAADCQECHSDGAAGPGQDFLFGGFVLDWWTKKGAHGIEVAVRDGDLFYYTCTDHNGFFFVPLAGNREPNWENVETRARGWIGEKIMPNDKEHHPSCNRSDCHADPEHPIIAP